MPTPAVLITPAFSDSNEAGEGRLSQAAFPHSAAGCPTGRQHCACQNRIGL